MSQRQLEALHDRWRQMRHLFSLFDARFQVLRHRHKTLRRDAPIEFRTMLVHWSQAGEFAELVGEVKALLGAMEEIKDRDVYELYQAVRRGEEEYPSAFWVEYAYAPQDLFNIDQVDSNAASPKMKRIFDEQLYAELRQMLDRLETRWRVFVSLVASEQNLRPSINTNLLSLRKGHKGPPN